MNIEEFRSRLATDQSPDALFDLGREIAIEIAMGGIESEGLVDSIIRLADTIDNSDKEISSGLLEMRSALLRHAGLFPYANPNFLNFRDQLAYESYRSDADQDIVYHREQLEIIEKLESGRNVILSAPTSFGKSLIIDVLCASVHRQKIVIIVPTIALIDETKRRLFARLGPEVQLIWNEEQERIPDRKLVYVLTQERALARTDLNKIDLLVIDEFYKIDASQEDTRTISLGLAVRRLVQSSKQFFMLGPMISSLLWRSPRVKYDFVQTDFRTVAVDVHRVDSDGSIEGIADFIAYKALRPTLVFCSSPNRARDMCVELNKRLFIDEANTDALSLATWVRQSFHEDWFASASIERGVGIHTGRIPRALAQLQIDLFDRGVIDVLVCTSSIIEGVNTAAKSVVIADSQIDRDPINFFTHENIKGRSGRMFKHFVGKVYLFHDAPPHGRTEVDLEYVDGTVLPDSFVAGIDAGDDPPLVARQQALSSAIGLSPEVIREFSVLSLDTLQKLVKGVQSRIEKKRFGICWDGMPPWPRLRSTIELIWDCARPRTASAPTAASALRLLVIADKQKNVGGFIREVAANDFKGIDHGVDVALAFLKVMEYHLPIRLAALEAIIKEIWLDPRAQAVNYSAYISAVKSWFSINSISSFEEIGLPAQLIEKYIERTDKLEMPSLLQRINEQSSYGADGLLKHGEALFLHRVISY